MCLSLLAGEKVSRGRVGLFRAHLFELLIDPPLMAKRIANLSVTSTPKHVLHRHQHGSAVRDSTGSDSIGVVHHDGDTHAGAAERFRFLASAAFSFGKFVAQKKFVSLE